MSFTLPSLRTWLGLFLSLWLIGAAHAAVPNNRA
jgi:formate dehydrogenase subunit gamma